MKRIVPLYTSDREAFFSREQNTYPGPAPDSLRDAGWLLIALGRPEHDAVSLRRPGG
jgi:hypothetical protein